MEEKAAKAKVARARPKARAETNMEEDMTTITMEDTMTTTMVSSV